jgi:hypothetical protein
MVNKSVSYEVSAELDKKISEWPKYVTLFLTFVGMIIGGAIWETNAHVAIKDWTAEQQYVTKQELKEVMKERYAPLTDLIKLQSCIENHLNQQQQLKETLDKFQRQLDRIEARQRR